MSEANETTAALQAELDRLKAENARLKSRVTGKLVIKRSEKGAVSVYGMGRWPVTLYASQWEALFAAIPTIQQFIETHRDTLAAKGDG